MILKRFCQSVALILWNQLSEGTPQHHQRSVELFYQLHNLVPSSSICEDVISQQLMHRDKVTEMQIRRQYQHMCLVFTVTHSMDDILMHLFFFSSRGSDWRPMLSSQFCGT